MRGRQILVLVLSCNVGCASLRFCLPDLISSRYRRIAIFPSSFVGKAFFCSWSRGNKPDPAHTGAQNNAPLESATSDHTTSSTPLANYVV